MEQIWFFLLISKIILSFQICIEKEIYMPDNIGGCQFSRKCILGKNHCILCNEEEYLCKSCDEGYFPDKNGGCSYTDNCEISYKGNCLQCINNFVLIGKNLNDVIKICKSLNSEDLRNCEKINIEAGICLTCKEGFYLTEIDKRCVQTKDCSQSKLGECIKCKYGYYSDKKDNKCKVQEGKLDNCQYTNDGITCEKCAENYYFNKDKECLRVNYCEKVNSYYKCLYCIDGYYLLDNENVCTPEINCLKGDRDFGICTLCIEGYYIDYTDFKCKSNKENNDFKYCEIANNGKCTKCINYYFLGEDNKCSESKNCADSKNAICNKCIENYYLGYDHKCTNVENCIYSNYNYECLECEGNYFFDKNSKKCVVAEGDFENCKSGYKGWLCLECKDDYYLNMTNHLCYSNLEDNDFYKCIVSDSKAEHCANCAKNFYLGHLDYKCTNIIGCELSHNRIRCKECNERYYLNVFTGKCIYNNEIENENEIKFYGCNKTNPEGTFCENCKNGLVLDENKLCVDKKHCIDMENNKCKKCRSDYCLNEIFGCVEVIFEFNYCAECNDIFDFNNCTKCIEGYELDEYGDCLEIIKEEEFEEEIWEYEYNNLEDDY